MQTEFRSSKKKLRKLKILMLEEALQTKTVSNNQNIQAFIEYDDFYKWASRIYTGISTFSSFIFHLDLKFIHVF